MKKIGLGIALLLFALLLQQAIPGLELVALCLGAIGLIIAIIGAVKVE